MLLASCGFMLMPILASMREQGIPFSNKYRLKQKGWNPMDTKAIGQMRSFLSDATWTTPMLQQWVPLLRSEPKGPLKHGAKTIVKHMADPVSAEAFDDLFVSKEEADNALRQEVDWFYNNATATDQKRLAYARALAQGDMLYADPLGLTVGTIHSVKGGEADHVLILDDLTTAQVQGDHDALHRLYYVATTRAKIGVTMLSNISFG